MAMLSGHMVVQFVLAVLFFSRSKLLCWNEVVAGASCCAGLKLWWKQFYCIRVLHGLQMFTINVGILSIGKAVSLTVDYGVWECGTIALDSGI
jgi:hypothetical protein